MPRPRAATRALFEDTGTRRCGGKFNVFICKRCGVEILENAYRFAVHISVCKKATPEDRSVANQQLCKSKKNGGLEGVRNPHASVPGDVDIYSSEYPRPANEDFGQGPNNGGDPYGNGRLSEDLMAARMYQAPEGYGISHRWSEGPGMYSTFRRDGDSGYSRMPHMNMSRNSTELGWSHRGIDLETNFQKFIPGEGHGQGQGHAYLCPSDQTTRVLEKVVSKVEQQQQQGFNMDHFAETSAAGMSNNGMWGRNMAVPPRPSQGSPLATMSAETLLDSTMSGSTEYFNLSSRVLEENGMGKQDDLSDWLNRFGSGGYDQGVSNNAQQPTWDSGEAEMSDWLSNEQIGTLGHNPASHYMGAGNTGMSMMSHGTSAAGVNVGMHMDSNMQRNAQF